MNRNTKPAKIVIATLIAALLIVGVVFYKNQNKTISSPSSQAQAQAVAVADAGPIGTSDIAITEPAGAELQLQHSTSNKQVEAYQRELQSRVQSER